VKRVENGESVENIVSDGGLMVSTAKESIKNSNRYFVIYEKNGIVPEDGTNV
jgi:hypothetical protein